MRKLFDTMSEDAKSFYSKIFNTAVLNLHAVRRGYFDTLICETEDPTIMIRWREAVPQIVHIIKLQNMKNLDD